ncbi:MAG: hypothetical protein JXA99_04390 [Candidatus Lokiarchaeota archaeon]|nr:hypothetical protein [Candidatus Lokiarchaeota archaeon]
MQSKIKKFFEIQIYYTYDPWPTAIDHDNSKITLEYIKVGGIDFWEIEPSENSDICYNPTIGYLYKDVFDGMLPYKSTGAMENNPLNYDKLIAGCPTLFENINNDFIMSFNSRHPGKRGSGDYDGDGFFRPSMTCFLANDRSIPHYKLDNWINSLELNLRIIRSDGTVINHAMGQTLIGLFPSKNAYNYDISDIEESAGMLEQISFWTGMLSTVGLIPTPYTEAAGVILEVITIIIDVILALSKYQSQPPTEKVITEGEDLSAKWETGFNSYFANPDLNNFGMDVRIDPDFQLDNSPEDPGFYQIQFSWKADIRRLFSFFLSDQNILPNFQFFYKKIITGSYYINFEYKGSE